MSAFVLDCSAAMCWIFSDEASEATDALLARTVRFGAVVPSHWRLEVANTLRQAERRGRISPDKSTDFLRRVGELRIRIDSATIDLAFGPTLDLARAEALTVYDAAYLELSMRLGLPLASKDRELAAAARRRGVELIL